MTIDLLVLPASWKMKRGRIAPSKLARFLLVEVADSSLTARVITRCISKVHDAQARRLVRSSRYRPSSAEAILGRSGRCGHVRYFKNCWNLSTVTSASRRMLLRSLGCHVTPA